MTASIKEALEQIASVETSLDKTMLLCQIATMKRVAAEALASLSCGEARERIARMIRRAMIDNPTGGTSEEMAAKRASIADEYATAYLADLATGCVPGEEPELFGRYSVTIAWSDEDQAFIATIPELPGCMADGDTHVEALIEIGKAQSAWIDACMSAGKMIPEFRPFGAPPAEEASIRADQVIMPRALVEQAHAAMLETGWHLAPAHATSGDGVIEAAVAEIEERFAAAIRAGRGE